MAIYSGSTSSLANPVNFLVYRNAALNSGNNAFAIVNFDTAVYDTGGNVDLVSSVGRFTPPITGYYHIESTLASNGAISSDCIISVFKGGAEYARGGRNKLAANGDAVSVSLTLKLTASTDYIEINSFGNAQFGLAVGTAPMLTYFSGFLVSKT